MASDLLSNPAAMKLALQVYAMKKSLGSLGKSPLNNGGGGGGDVEEGTTQKKVLGEDTDDAIMAALPYIVYILAGIGLVCGGISMLFYEAVISDFAALCLLIIAPVVAFQKWRLLSLDTLRGQHNLLREKCNTLHNENNKLTATIDEMESQLGRLSEVEEGLSKIAKQNGTQVDRLVSIVKENGELQLKVKKALERQVMQDIVDIVVSSDRDGNFTLGPKETEMLKIRLKGISGIIFSQENFNRMLENDTGELTVSDVMHIMRNLLDDDVPRERNVFVLDPESLVK